MSLSVITTFLKSFWRELSIVLLALIVFGLHLQNEALRVTVSLKNQEIVNIEERLKISNASVSQLQVEIDAQNKYIQSLSQEYKQKQETLTIKLQESKMKIVTINNTLEEYITNKSNLSGNVCEDVLSELNKIGS